MENLTTCCILISCVLSVRSNNIQPNSRSLLSSGTEFDVAWTNAGSMGTRTNADSAVFNYNNKIYILGSVNNPTGLYECDITNKQCTDKSSTNALTKNIQTYAQSYTQIGNLGYVIGDATSNPTDLYVYDLTTTNTPSLTSTITIQINRKGNRACLTSTTNQLFVIGGQDPTCSTSCGSYFRATTLQIYNLPDGPWETNPTPDMKDQRESFSCVVVNDYLYAIGGYSYYFDYSYSKNIDKIEKIQITNILNNAWANTPYTLLQGIEATRAVTIGDFIIVIGGRTLYDGAVTKAQSVQVINTQLNTIKYGGTLFTPLYSGGVIVVDNTICSFGGIGASGSEINTWQYLRIETNSPTSDPTEMPTRAPSHQPTRSPTNNPSKTPTKSPTAVPTGNPTSSPTDAPTIRTNNPTLNPNGNPTQSPTNVPTKSPTSVPTGNPTASPTGGPTTNTNSPSIAPTEITNAPVRTPSPTTTTITPTTPLDVNNQSKSILIVKSIYTFTFLILFIILGF